MIDYAELRTLAATINEIGLINPITLVKLDIPDEEQEYQVIAGRRRFRALVEILKHHELIEGLDFRIMPTGCDAESISLVENFERKNLTLSEEVDVISRLMERIGLDEIAKLLGRTKAWVALRSNLSKLSPRWMECLKENNNLSITAGHYEVIARLPEAQQEKLYEEMDNCGTLTDEAFAALPEFKKDIEDRQMLRLSNAKFDRTVCKECENRSQAAAWLFEDLQDPAEDRCLDPECYANRLEAFVKTESAKILEANKKGGKIYLITTYYSSQKNGVIGSCWYERIDNLKTRPKEPNAFIVDGVNIGAYCFIKVDEKRLNTASASSCTAGGSGYGEKKEKTMAYREAELLHKRQRLAIEKLIKHLRESKDYTMPTLETMFRMSACLGVNPLEYSMSGLHGYKTVAKMTENKLLAQYWIKLLENVCGNLGQDISGTLDQVRIERAEIICDLVEITWDDFLVDATEEIAEPKSWAALRAAEEKAKSKTDDVPTEKSKKSKKSENEGAE
jgi:ParB/RepB/Spo0J family partition protein